MNTKKTAGLAFLLIAATCACLLTGCDKAQETLEKADLGATADVTTLVGKITKTLSGITDVKSAQAALPQLKDIDVNLDDLASKATNMTSEQQGKLSTAIGGALPQITTVITKLKSMTGVGEIVGPTLDSLLSKFKALK